MRWLEEFNKGKRLEELANRFDTIEGWTPALAGYALYCAAKYPEVQGEVVEIGSWKGRSTCWIAEGSPMYAVDVFDGGEMLKGQANGSTFGQFIDNISHQGLVHKVTPIIGDSVEVAKTWELPIRMMFIDGNHSYEGVKKDWESWKYFLVDGAIVFFDDVGGNYEGAKRFFDELGIEPILTIGYMKAIYVDSSKSVAS